MVSIPVHRQFRETIEHVAGAASGFGYHIEDFRDKSFEAQFRMQCMAFDRRCFRHDLGVTGKTEINNGDLVLQALFIEGVCERYIIVDRPDLEHDIVALHQALQHMVHARQPGTEKQFRFLWSD